MTKYLIIVGEIFLNSLKSLGSISLFFFRSVLSGFSPPWYFKQFIKQFLEIGFFSLPIVAFTAFFSGMVLALQTYTGFARFSAESAVAQVVALSLTRELGPVLAGLMLSGRIGASIAAEIGTMRVTEQIDALFTLSTSPFKYVIFPRIFSGLLLMPILVLIADIIGIFGGYVVSVYKLDFNYANYINQTIKYLYFDDVMSGLIKASVFGVVVTFMGCYYGYNSKGGAEGVGQAAIKSVVSSSILILFLNYILTDLLFKH